MRFRNCFLLLVLSCFAPCLSVSGDIGGTTFTMNDPQSGEEIGVDSEISAGGLVLTMTPTNPLTVWAFTLNIYTTKTSETVFSGNMDSEAGQTVGTSWAMALEETPWTVGSAYVVLKVGGIVQVYKDVTIVAAS